MADPIALETRNYTIRARKTSPPKTNEKQGD